MSDDNDDGFSFNNIVVDELGSYLSESLEFHYNSSTQKKNTKWAESHYAEEDEGDEDLKEAFVGSDGLCKNWVANA